MDKIIELINIVNRNKVKSIEVIGKSTGNSTLLNKFYDGVHDQKILTEEDAFQYLYGGNAKHKKAYYKLKHTLKDRLLNTLFLIDVKDNKYSNRNRAYLESQKGMMALNFIVNAGITRKSAIWLAEKLLRTATRWRFTEIAIASARVLRGYHASKSGNRKQFEKYNQLALDYQELQNVELLAESMYSDVVSYYVNDKSTKHFIYDLANQHLQKLNQYNPNIKSAKFYYQKAMLEIAKYMSINDYKMTEVLCVQALKDLNSLKYQHGKAIVAIGYQLIACYIQLKKYDEGKKQIETILSIQDAETFNWFKAHELYLSLCFHTQQYDVAWDVYHTISNNKKFKHLPSNVREVWKIYEAWLYLLAQLNKINPKQDESIKTKTFRVSRFINEMSTFSKDKKGLNIPILIIHILLLLQQKKYNTLIDRVEAIAKYVDRYIKRAENSRSNYMLRMILEIPKNDFDSKQITAKTIKHYTALKEIPIDVSSQSHDLELLPYEDTWELIIEILERK